MPDVLVDRHGQALHQTGRTPLPPSTDFRQVNGWCTSRVLALQDAADRRRGGSAAQAMVEGVVRQLPATRRNRDDLPLRPQAVTVRTLTRPGCRADKRSARIVAAAARWLTDGRRLDMQGLADELGISRVTLFRRVGSREALLSKALWMLTQCTLETAAAQWEAERPEGELHTPGTGRYINAIVAQSKGLRRLLDDEPALAIRVLTDPRGQVQTGIVAFIEELLRRDIEEFGLITLIEPDALAYALVRLGESFLYADVLAARKPDVETANRLQRALIEGVLP
jgi:AcrR family transcriptional regulator